jgi:hypothetical protein
VEVVVDVDVDGNLNPPLSSVRVEGEEQAGDGLR